MYGCCGALLKLCCTVRQLSYCFFPSLFLFSLLLLALLLLLLLRLKVWPRDVFPLKIWVIHPSWIVVGVEVVLPLILAQFAQKKNYQIDKNCFHAPLHKNHKKWLFGWNLQWLLPTVLLLTSIMLGLLIAYLARVLLWFSLLFLLVIAIDSDLMTSHQAILKTPSNVYVGPKAHHSSFDDD